MFSLKTSKGFPKTDRFFKKILSVPDLSEFNKYGERGVEALAANTPEDTGTTANSWVYEVTKENGQVRVSFFNTNVNKGVNIAIILQYGHGTGTGGYVQGRDYINPAVRPIFDEMAESAWKEVKNA